MNSERLRSAQRILLFVLITTAMVAATLITVATLPRAASADCAVGGLDPCALPDRVAEQAESNEAWLEDYAERTVAAVASGKSYLCVLHGKATAADQHKTFTGSSKCRAISHSGTLGDESAGGFTLNGPGYGTPGDALVGHSACSRKGSGTGSIDIASGETLTFGYQLNTSVNGDGYLSGQDESVYVSEQDEFVEGPVSISSGLGSVFCNPYTDLVIDAVLVVQRDVDEISGEVVEHDVLSPVSGATSVALALPLHLPDSWNGPTISVYAADARQNHITIARTDLVIVSDSAGVEPGVGCVLLTPQTAGCIAVDHLSVRAGDLNDTVAASGPASFKRAHMDGGTGNDTLEFVNVSTPKYCGSGQCWYYGLVSGGAGDDTIRGGTGEDEVFCGAGNDVAYVGTGDDYSGYECETVTKTP